MAVVHRSFSGERGPGTFHSLGVLPKRTLDPPRKSTVFHIAHDDDDECSPTPSSAAYFPSMDCSSTQSSPSTPSPTSPRPPLARGASTPILLPNGKPLKPSLKLSSSSPAMLIPPHMHLRARSEPSTPKNVHFPEKENALATICVFNRSARPAALCSPANANGDETETDAEDTPPARFPFSSPPCVFNYEIDPMKSSPVPLASTPLANLRLESLNLSSSPSPSTASTPKPSLMGSILVRNLAFEKHVGIRFTLDDWQTVSEVGAHYADSLSAPPSKIFASLPPGDTEEGGWDRFTFTIRLEDYVPSLSTRILWLAARYRVNSTYPVPGSSKFGPGGEWWDNNGGENYRIAFRPSIAVPPSPWSKPRRETISAPISSPSIELPPPTTCKEHALGLVVPSIHTKEKRSAPLRTGKLDLCNYVPPTVRAAPSISFPSAGSPQTPSPSLVTNATSPPSDEDNASPSSSTLSTPSVSPTMVPRVIIGGQPTTTTDVRDDDDAISYSKPGYIADWDWSAMSKLCPEKVPHQHFDAVPGSEPPQRPRGIPLLPDRKALSNGNALYHAFITQWCFAQGPTPSHRAYDGGGIMT